MTSRRCALHAALMVFSCALPPTHAAAQSSDTYVLITGVIGGVTGYRRIEQRLVALGHRVVTVNPYQLGIDSTNVSFDGLARLVHADLEARGVGTVKVVGHAHGGGVALRLAAHFPKQVSQVFLLNVGALAGNKSPVFSSSIRLAPLLAHMPGGRSFLRRRIADGIRANSGHPAWLDDATSRAYSDPLLDNIGRVVRMAQRLGVSQEPEPLSAVLQRVRVPVTLLIGALTCPASPAAPELAALAPLGTMLRVHSIEETCHFPHEEKPELIVQYLTRPR